MHSGVKTPRPVHSLCWGIDDWDAAIASVLNCECGTPRWRGTCSARCQTLRSHRAVLACRECCASRACRGRAAPCRVLPGSTCGEYPLAERPAASGQWSEWSAVSDQRSAHLDPAWLPVVWSSPAVVRLTGSPQSILGRLLSSRLVQCIASSRGVSASAAAPARSAVACAGSAPARPPRRLRRAACTAARWFHIALNHRHCRSGTALQHDLRTILTPP